MEDSTKIAGDLTIRNWKDRVDDCDPACADGWQELFDDFIVNRVETRYFKPLEQIEKICDNSGEGFSAALLHESVQGIHLVNPA